MDWQRGLRRQFGREQAFDLENLSSEPFFSEFRVSNPVSKSSYRVAIRGRGPAGTDCPSALKKAAAALFNAERDGMLPEERFGEIEPFMAMASKSGHEFRAYDDALDFVAGRRDADRRV